MKVFYMVYFSVMAVLVLNSISIAMFKRCSVMRKAKRIVGAVLFSAIWPLTLFSAEGRKIIFQKTTKL